MRYKLATLLTLILLTGPSTALGQGYAAAPWPQQAQGRSLPKPDWVLAIPARRNADNSLTIWDRTDEWANAWRVPRSIDGIRVVTLMGDAQDSRSITSQAIDGMLVADMQVVLQKYGAPALALIVSDGTSVAVAGYVPGWQASWQSVSAGADTLEARENSLQAIADMFVESGGTRQAQQQPEQGVSILATRINPETGGTDYRLGISGSEAAMTSYLDIIATMPGAVIVDVARESAGQATLVVQTPPGYAGFENDLRVYGLLP